MNTNTRLNSAEHFILWLNMPIFFHIQIVHAHYQLSQQAKNCYFIGKNFLSLLLTREWGW